MSQENELTADDYAVGDAVLRAGATECYIRDVLSLADYSALTLSLLFLPAGLSKGGGTSTAY